MSPTAPLIETPLQKRERLRGLVRAKGMQPGNVETVSGDGDDNIVQQIRDLESWLALD
jgi:hypothetical protein